MPYGLVTSTMRHEIEHRGGLPRRLALMVLDELDKTRRDARHWRANHDDQVRIKRNLHASYVHLRSAVADQLHAAQSMLRPGSCHACAVVEHQLASLLANIGDPDRLAAEDRRIEEEAAS